MLVLALALALALVTGGDRAGSAGVTVRLPPGWHSTKGADGNVTNPLTRVVVASAPIRPRWTGCQIAAYAFPRDAVAIVIVEWLPPLGGTQPPRPRRFDARTLPVVRDRPVIECFDGGGGTAFFADHGRRFGAYLLVGRRAPARLVAQARAVLQTLRVERR